MRQDIEGFTDRDLLIEVYTIVKDLQVDFTKLHHQIHGNGQPGIKDRLAKVEERTSPTKVIGISGALGASIAAVFAEIVKRLS